MNFGGTKIQSTSGMFLIKKKNRVGREGKQAGKGEFFRVQRGKYCFNFLVIEIWAALKFMDSRFTGTNNY